MGTFREHAVVEVGMWWHWPGVSALHSVTSPPRAAFFLSVPWCNDIRFFGKYFEICRLKSWLLLLLSLLQMCLLNPPGSSGRTLLTP